MSPLRLSLCAFVGLVALLPFQEPSPRAQAPPGEGGLDWQVGAWVGTRRDAADGSTEPMTMTVASILGGAGQMREIEIPHSGGVYRGFAVQVFEPESGVWSRRYVNDVRRTFASYACAPHERTVEGDRSIWRSITPGRTRESRLASVHETPADGPERWSRTMTVSTDDGATWTELWCDELTRKMD